MLVNGWTRTMVRWMAKVLIGAAVCGAAVAQVTSLNMVSEPGDYIGQGQTYSLTPADGAFTAQVNFQGGVSIAFNSPTSFWSLDFASANGTPLTPGTYTGAVRFPFNTGVNGLSVYGDGRGCNTLTGNFTVRQVVYGANNTVEAFEAVFEQNCEGLPPTLRGEVRYNANVALYLNGPATLRAIQGQNTRFTVTGVDSQQRRVRLSASALPPDASFVDLGNSTGVFNWTPTTTQSGAFVATFVGDNQQGNVASLTTRITVTPPPPFNDDFASPAVITSIPTAESQVVTDATAAADDPNCFGTAQSVWYAVTPATTMRLEVNTFGSGYDTAIGVYTGSRGALTTVSCNGDAANGLQSRVRFEAKAGTTYYIMVSSQFFPVASANLVLNVVQAPPPFTFVPSVTQFGAVVPSTGAATVNGMVHCSAPTFVSLSGSLRQVRGSVPVNGFWSIFTACDGATRWSAPVQYSPTVGKGRSAALFSGGKATVGVTALAFDPETGESKFTNFNTEITLRGR